MNIKEKAKKFAIKKHKNQKRKNGEDYINHPINVAGLVKIYKKSHNLDNLISAAYLHDILEDTNTSYYELVKCFGYNIANLVLELTTNEDMKNDIGKAKYLAYKLKAMTNWALTIKLCDRLHNISDLYKINNNFKNKYINETKYIINYLTNNRNLNNTQKNIIKKIKTII